MACDVNRKISRSVIIITIIKLEMSNCMISS